MTESKRIGKYEIVEEIGRGGFAVVYKARDTSLDRIVALKVLHPQHTIDPKFIRRFRQEAQTAARLHHPHIVTIYEVGEEAGQHYIAMVFLPGRTLDKVVDGKPLPTDRAISITEQVADALDAIHEQGLVHRDVKPGNVMVDEAGQATLLDFGIVRAAEGTRLTTTMTTLGTPEYMAPEQAEIAEGTPDIDWRADIYALGVVAYEMLVGQPPFTGRSPTAILHKHVYEQPPAPRTLNPDLPQEMEPVLLKALAKRPAQRYQSAGAFARALREALAAAEQARQREAQLAETYTQLQAAIASEDWAAAETHCHAILALVPDYRDVPDLLDQAREAQAEQEEQLARLYQQAQTALQQGLWQEAQESCDNIESLAGADYRDVRDLRRQAVAGLQRAQTEQERQAGLAQLYERLQAAAAQEDWAEVLTLGGRIQALDPTYRDVARRTEKARRELRRSQRGPLPRWVWGVGGVVVLGVIVLLVAFGGRWNDWFAQGPTPGATQVRPADEMVMVYVPAGEFEMGSTEEGSDDERPVHTVALDAFWIDRTEVTNAQYALCVGDGVCDEVDFVNDADFNGGDYPVVGVSWYDAETYCKWVDARLPTEAEWEYAARGPENRVFPWGHDFDGTKVNYCDANCEDDWADETVDDGYALTAPVGSYPAGASWCGALDLAGNVWEWVADWYDGDYYERSPTHNSPGPEEGDGKVLRGGSWGDVPDCVRGADRNMGLPDSRVDYVGFRCARGSE
jgi:formylglycine-generating enzyme required for sulfatase activity/predicted Ser/Thr protein kinase